METRKELTRKVLLDALKSNIVKEYLAAWKRAFQELFFNSKPLISETELKEILVTEKEEHFLEPLLSVSAKISEENVPDFFQKMTLFSESCQIKVILNLFIHSENEIINNRCLSIINQIENSPYEIDIIKALTQKSYQDNKYISTTIRRIKRLVISETNIEDYIRWLYTQNRYADMNLDIIMAFIKNYHSQNFAILLSYLITNEPFIEKRKDYLQQCLMCLLRIHHTHGNTLDAISAQRLNKFLYTRLDNELLQQNVLHFVMELLANKKQDNSYLEGFCTLFTDHIKKRKNFRLGLSFLNDIQTNSHATPYILKLWRELYNDIGMQEDTSRTTEYGKFFVTLYMAQKSFSKDYLTQDFLETSLFLSKQQNDFSIFKNCLERIKKRHPNYTQLLEFAKKHPEWEEDCLNELKILPEKLDVNLCYELCKSYQNSSKQANYLPVLEHILQNFDDKEAEKRLYANIIVTGCPLQKQNLENFPELKKAKEDDAALLERLKLLNLE